MIMAAHQSSGYIQSEDFFILKLTSKAAEFTSKVPKLTSKAVEFTSK